MAEYTIKIEKKYMEDVQNEQYRAVILDAAGKRVISGDYLFDEAAAQRDGHMLLRQAESNARRSRYGTDLNVMTQSFYDEHGFGKQMKYGMCIIGIPTAIAVAVSFLVTGLSPYDVGNPLDAYCILAIAAVMVVAFIYFFINQWNYCGNEIVYALREGEFYRIAGSVDIRILPRESYFREIKKDNGTWRIVYVRESKRRRGVYCFRCTVRRCRDGKLAEKWLYIREGYNDFAKLMNCFEYLSDSSTERKGY